MYEKIRGVVLRTIKYNDKNAIVRVYTDAYGILPFLLPQSNGKSARMRRAIFQPLSLVEIETDIKPGREIYRIQESRCAFPLASLHADPVKNAISLFLTELLSHIIIEQEQNLALFSYISSSIKFLDATDRPANFHICFLYHLGAFIGIEPDMSTYRDNSYFDMLDGIFVASPPIHKHYIGTEASAALMRLSRMTFANMHFFRFNREQRKQLIRLVVDYYRLHSSSIGEINSIDILSELWE